jgi:hypothetical protein
MSGKGKRAGPKADWQEHDVWYVVDCVQDAYQQQPRHVIQRVVGSCKEEMKPVEGREKLLAMAKEKMRLMMEARGGEERRASGRDDE